MTAIAQRLVAELPGKLAGTAMFCCGVAGYLTVQRLHLGTAVTMPWTPIDLLIPEMPILLWVYTSQWMLFGLPSLLIDERRTLFWHLMGYMGIVIVTLLCFVLWPTTVDRPHGGGNALSMLRRFDGAGNACPSLHAACAVYAAMTLRYAMSVPLVWTMIAWIWTALVLISCVSLRQHTGYDVIAGVLLACIADRCVVWRLRQRSEPTP